MTTAETDAQYTTSTIEAVEHCGDSWEFRSSEGWSFGFEASDAPEFTPRVGDEVRTYGRGFGYPVRGLVIAERTIFYRTEAEEAARFAAEMAERKATRLRDFEATGRATLDAKYAALPAVFQQRIDRFRANNPDFRVEYEGYEMFCCEEAVKLASALTTEDGVRAFAGLSYEQQKMAVPSLAYAEHSGNTFGATIALARLYLADASYVPRMHGALSPLVGSAAYGDIPRSETPA